MNGEKEAVFNFLNINLPILILIGFILLVFVYGIYFYKLKTKKQSKIFKVLDLIEKFALPLGFLASLAGTLMSLIYSEYFGQIPCGLCWFQRVFLYSQLILYIVAYVKNDKKVFSYTLPLSIVGALIAIYHEFIQIGYSELIPCPASSGVVDCAKPLFLEYGFVTFPFSSLILFLFLILLSLLVKSSNKN